MTEEWLTIPDAARFYGITENAMRQRIKRRRGAGTEKRGGIIFVKVETSDQSALVAASPTPNDAITRLTEAMERHNELLTRLLELDEEPPPAPKKWRWPWKARQS